MPWIEAQVKNVAATVASGRISANSLSKMPRGGSCTAIAGSVTRNGTVATTSATVQSTSRPHVATVRRTGSRTCAGLWSTCATTHVSIAVKRTRWFSILTTAIDRQNACQSARCFRTTAGRRSEPRSPNATCAAPTTTDGEPPSKWAGVKPSLRPKWQGRQDLNSQPPGLEPGALPIELRP